MSNSLQAVEEPRVLVGFGLNALVHHHLKGR